MLLDPRVERVGGLFSPDVTESWKQDKINLSFSLHLKARAREKESSLIRVKFQTRLIKVDFKHVRDQSEPQCHVPCSCTQHIQRHSFMQSTDEEKPTAEKETLLNCLIRFLCSSLLQAVCSVFPALCCVQICC